MLAERDGHRVRKRQREVLTEMLAERDGHREICSQREV